MLSRGRKDESGGDMAVEGKNKQEKAWTSRSGISPLLQFSHMASLVVV